MKWEVRQNDYNNTYDVLEPNHDSGKPDVCYAGSHFTVATNLDGKETAELIAAAPSMKSALWAIANMQITEHTNKSEVLALCMSIAQIELEKLS